MIRVAKGKTMSDAALSEAEDVYKTAFDPGAYLQTYYSEPQIPDDEVFNIRSLIEFLGRSGRTFDSALEVGCGPTIHHAVPLARHVKKLYLSDYLPGNLAEVQKWLEGTFDAHDWSAYIRGTQVLEEITPTDEAIQQRAKDLRAAIKGLLPCNLLVDEPLGRPDKYDLVTCFYTAECAARSRAEWELVMQRLSRLVNPGGVLFQVAMRNGHSYKIHDRVIPAVAVNEADFATVLPRCGFAPDLTTISPFRITAWADHGFDGICLVTAVKE